MTWSVFHIIEPLCGESTCHRWKGSVMRRWPVKSPHTGWVMHKAFCCYNIFMSYLSDISSYLECGHKSRTNRVSLTDQPWERIPSVIHQHNIHHWKCWYMEEYACDGDRPLIISRYTLTHRGRDEIDAILQTPFSNAFYWMKMYWFRLTNGG